MKMFGMKPLELILLVAVGYLIWDKFKAKPVVVSTSNTSGNTAPGIIKNYSEVGDNFDIQVEALMRNTGL
jgi:hypothetical protein